MSAVAFDHTQWGGQCHAASLALIRSGELDHLGVPLRVARGVCRGVGSQHSWVVCGDDCYAPDAKIIDPTLWSYDDSVKGVWRGVASKRPHTPHGSGSIWTWGKPVAQGGDPMTLVGPDGEDVVWSPDAEMFLSLIGPLDNRGWRMLAHAPVGGGWPAAEIMGAIWDDDRTRHGCPIDVIGMITDRNPMELYA